MNTTQDKRVLDILLKDGRITNFWAVHNYILRLGAVIHRLRARGYVITTAYEIKDGKKTKNTVYTLVK